MTDDLREQIRRLEELVAGPAGSLAYPALAEAHRRGGCPEEAERVAREGLERAPHVSAGRVALALALLDQKREDETRAELERLLGGDTEHAIVHEAVASESPEGFGSLDPQISGGLATLEPYPDEPHASDDGWVPQPSDVSIDPIAAAAIDPIADEAPLSSFAEPREEDAPSVAREPAASGPFGPPPPPAPAQPLVFDDAEVRDDELDSAFDEAEADRDQMLGADDVAQAALSAVPDEEDGDAELDPVPRVDVAEGEDDFAPAAGVPGATEMEGADGEVGVLPGGAGSPFATETVAGLLEQQGHVEDAERLREQLSAPEAAIGAAEPEAGETEPTSASADASGAAPEPAKQATLERWLDNLRRDNR